MAGKAWNNVFDAIETFKKRGFPRGGATYVDGERGVKTACRASRLVLRNHPCAVAHHAA
jgi:hypothetical protein